MEVQEQAAEWVREAAAGDQGAWRRLVDQYSGLIWAVARSFNLGASDGADIVQITWLRLFEHLDRIDQPERVGAWLATTARRECMALYRRHARSTLLPDEALDRVVDLGPAPDQAVLAGEEDAAVLRALDMISEPCRHLLRLLATDPAPSYAEVSAALDMPVGSIGPTRGRCLDQLRRKIATQGVDADLLDRR